LTSDDSTSLGATDLDALSARGATLIVGDASVAAARDARLSVICAKFNGGISARLCHGALDGFASFGILASAVSVAWVPGAFELPLAAMRSATDGRADAVVCLGAVIRGDTAHFEFVAGECAAGIQRVSLDSGVPVVFGVLTTDTVAQALERSVPGPANKGYEAAVTALEMLDLLPQLAARPTAVPAGG
jgi:6,7-dimethyl-8-ribityllumazine synthase